MKIAYPGLSVLSRRSGLSMRRNRRGGASGTDLRLDLKLTEGTGQGEEQRAFEHSASLPNQIKKPDLGIKLGEIANNHPRRERGGGTDRPIRI